MLYLFSFCSHSTVFSWISGFDSSGDYHYRWAYFFWNFNRHTHTQPHFGWNLKSKRIKAIVEMIILSSFQVLCTALNPYFIRIIIWQFMDATSHFNREHSQHLKYNNHWMIIVLKCSLSHLYWCFKWSGFAPVLLNSKKALLFDVFLI